MLSLGMLSLLGMLMRLLLRLRLSMLQHLLLDHLILDWVLTLLWSGPIWHRLTRSSLGRHRNAVGGKHCFSLVLLELLPVLNSQATLHMSSASVWKRAKTLD